MKTLYKTYTYEQIRTKQIAREARTGLKWDFYHIGDGYVLTVIAAKGTPLNEQAATKLLPHLDHEYHNFHTLAEKSGLTLWDVVTGAKTLAQAGQAVPTVNRNGNFYGVRRA